MRLPLFHRFLAEFSCGLHRWENACYGGKEWHHDVCDEEGLHVTYICSLTITKERDCEVLGLFQVTLGEEFVEQQIRPRLDSFEWSQCH